MTDKGFRMFSLRKKILLSVNVLMLVALLVVTAVTNALSSRVILQDSIKHTQNILSLVLIRCRNILDSALRSIDQLYYDITLMHNIRLLDEQEQPAETGRRLHEEIEYGLFSLEAASEYIHAICIITSGGRIYAHAVSNDLLNIAEIGKETFFAAAHAGRGRAVFVRVHDDSRYLLIARAMYGQDLSKPLYAFAVLLPLNNLEEDLKSHLKEYSPYFELFDKYTNDVLVRYDRSYFDSESFSDEIDDANKKTAGIYEDLLLNVLISFRDLGGPDWRAVLAVPKKVLYANLYSLSLVQVFVSLSVLLLASLTVFFLSRGIVRPLRVLVSKLKEFEESPAKMNLEVRRNDEIGYLYETMNRMSERLDHLINMVYKEQLNRKDAELKALQAQINPHFLFNTLETISWKARLEGSETASDMITALSKMLHVNIGREGRDIITIRDEIEYLEHYFFLQKKRHEDLIDFSCAVPDEVLQHSIPGLSFQPVAENAIFHNTPIQHMLKIRLKGYIREGKIYLEFRDNGKGVSEANRKHINSTLNGPGSYIITDSERKHKSVGLLNVHRRIQLMYGESCGISIEKSRSGARVVICIPVAE